MFLTSDWNINYYTSISYCKNTIKHGLTFQLFQNFKLSFCLFPSFAHIHSFVHSFLHLCCCLSTHVFFLSYSSLLFFFLLSMYSFQTYTFLSFIRLFLYILHFFHFLYFFLSFFLPFVFIFLSSQSFIDTSLLLAEGKQTVYLRCTNCTSNYLYSFLYSGTFNRYVFKRRIYHVHKYMCSLFSWCVLGHLNLLRLLSHSDRTFPKKSTVMGTKFCLTAAEKTPLHLIYYSYINKSPGGGIHFPVLSTSVRSVEGSRLPLKGKT